MKKVKVKIYNDSTNDIPEYKHDGDAGMDIRCSQNIMLLPNSVTLVHTGIYMELPIGYEMQVRPKSGLALNNGISILNSPGTIDSTYRGECNVLLFNNRSIAIRINIGDRIAQLVLKEQPKCIFKEVNSINNLTITNRGSKGFGSTGIK